MKTAVISASASTDADLIQALEQAIKKIRKGNDQGFNYSFNFRYKFSVAEVVNKRFGTLNEALEAASTKSLDLVALWPLGTNINYGNTCVVNSGGYSISVYRDNLGMYEMPITYKVK